MIKIKKLRKYLIIHLNKVINLFFRKFYYEIILKLLYLSNLKYYIPIKFGKDKSLYIEVKENH